MHIQITSSYGYKIYIVFQAIPFFEDMFDLKYPLEKIDLVAIPDFKVWKIIIVKDVCKNIFSLFLISNFQYGAMENWGILSYRDKFLFYDKTDSSELNKQVKNTNLKGNVA